MKKLFRLAALATMASLVATISVTTSCSDDDDDENNNPVVVDTTKNDTVVPPEQKDTVPVANQEEVFELEVGGSKSKAHSFISIQDKRTYSVAEVTMRKGAGVEIVFNGKNFISSSQSYNEYVKNNGCTAEVKDTDSDKIYMFVTSGGEDGKGYSGKIEVIEGEMKDETSTIKIRITRK